MRGSTSSDWSLRRRFRRFINASMKLFCGFAYRSSSTPYRTSNNSFPPSKKIDQRISPHVSKGKILSELPVEIQLKILAFLQPEQAIANRRVCRLWNRIILQNNSQLQKFPINIILRYNEELQSWCFEQDNTAESWLENTHNCQYSEKACSDRPYRVVEGRLQFRPILFANSNFDIFFDWLPFAKIFSLRIDGENNSASGISMLNDSIFEHLLQVFHLFRPILQLKKFSIENVDISQVSNVKSTALLKCFSWQSLENFRMTNTVGMQTCAIVETVLLSSNSQRLNLIDVTLPESTDCSSLTSNVNFLLDSILLNRRNLFLRIANPSVSLSQLSNFIVKWCRQPQVNFFRHLQFVAKDFSLADILRECRRHFVNVVGSQIRHSFETNYSIALNEWLINDKQHRITLQIEARQKGNTEVLIEELNSNECFKEMVFPGPFMTKKIQLTNRSGHCVAFNIRSNCKNVKTSADYAVVADVKVIDVGYQRTPNHSCHFSQCQLFIEWIAVSSLPFVHFDPAWFKSTTSVAMRRFPICIAA